MTEKTTDIVIRLRRGISLTADQYSSYPLCDEAADEIERLRSALMHYANRCTWGELDEGYVSAEWCAYNRCVIEEDFEGNGPWSIAREALQQ